MQSPGDAAAGAIAVVFDCGQCLGEELVELQRTAAALAPAPLIAILHFPRIEDCDRARQAGAAAVLAKPLQWEDLFAELDRLAATARRAADRTMIVPWLNKTLQAIARIPARGLIAAVLVYKITLSPLLGQHCRFQPTCSAYFIGAVRKYGVVRGAWRGVCRICRCHPWNPGGYDPP